jgi:di/tricarboxylate transporter
MLKRMMAILLLPLVLLQLTGCTKQSWIGAAEPRPEQPEKVRVIRTVDGEEVRLDAMPTPIIENDSLHASVAGESYSIATERIADYKVERADVRSTLALVLIPVVVAGVIATVAMAEAFSDWDNVSVGKR